MIDFKDAVPFPADLDKPSTATRGPIDELEMSLRRPLIAVHVARWLPPGIEMVHIALTLSMLVWAVTLVLPEPTFPTSRMYGMFEACWPYTEGGWACVFAVPGALGVVGFFVRRKHRMLRLNIAGILMLSHVFLALMARGGNPGGTGWRIYALVLVPLSIWRVLAEAYIEWIDPHGA